MGRNQTRGKWRFRMEIERFALRSQLVAPEKKLVQICPVKPGSANIRNIRPVAPRFDAQ
jgi:hypothetical protein